MDTMANCGTFFCHNLVIFEPVVQTGSSCKVD